MLRKKVLNFIRPSEKCIYNIYESQKSEILDRLRLGFSHLRKHNFRHNFTRTLTPLCSCALETESTDHFYLCCLNYVWICKTLTNELNSINCEIFSFRAPALLEVIFYGYKKLNVESNDRILIATINYIKNTQRF